LFHGSIFGVCRSTSSLHRSHFCANLWMPPY
jgi:hypothetical protein